MDVSNRIKKLNIIKLVVCSSEYGKTKVTTELDKML